MCPGQERLAFRCIANCVALGRWTSQQEAAALNHAFAFFA